MQEDFDEYDIASLEKKMPELQVVAKGTEGPKKDRSNLKKYKDAE